MARVARLLLAITGNADDAKRELRDTAREVKRFGREKASAQIDVDAEEALGKLGDTREELRQVDLSRPEARVTVQVQGALVELDRVQARLARLAAQEPSPEVSVRTARATVALERIQARLALLAATDVDIDVNVRGAALARLQALGAGMDQTGARGGLLSRAMAGLSSSMAGAGTAGGSAVRAGLGPLTAALNPATLAAAGLAGVIATSLVAALTAMVASAGMAVVALGALAIGGFGALLAAAPLVGATIARYNAQMNTAGKAANMLRQSLGAMSEAFNEVATKQGAEILMRGLSNAVSALIPMVEKLRPAFTSLGTDMARGIRLAGNDVAALGPKIATMVTRSGPLFRNLARTVGPLAETLLNIANAVLPHLTAMVGRAVETFKGWATATGDADRLGSALEGVMGHLRSWGNLIGSLGGLMGAFFSAIAPLGKGLVDDLAAAADKTAEWVRSAQGTAKVRETFSALAEAAKAIASAVASVVIGFASLAAAAAPAIGPLLEGMREVGRVLIASLGPAAVKLGELFAKLVDAVKPALPFFKNVVGPLLKGVLDGIIFAVEPLIAVLKVFAEILGWLGEKAKPLKGVFEGIGAVIGFVFAGPILGAVGGTLRAVGGAFGLLGRAIQGTGKFLSWIGGLVGKLLSGPLTALKGIGGAIGGGFTKLGGVAKTAWGGIKGAVGGAARGAKNVAVGAFNALKSGAGKAWGATKSAAASVWNSGIANTIKGAAGKAKSGAITAFNGLKSGAVTAFNGVKAGAARIFGGLRDFVVGKVSAAGRAIGNLASGFFNMGMNLIKGLIRGVKAMAGNVVAAVRNVVNGAKNAAKRLLGIGSPSKVFDDFGRNVGQGFANGIVAAAPAALAAAKKMVTGVVKHGSVSAREWERLKAAGWKGRKGDSQEALYAPRNVRRAAQGGAAIGRAYAQGMVRHGSVSAREWERLKSQGWRGRAGDKMEALYAPSAAQRLGRAVSQGFANGIAGARKVVTFAARNMAQAAPAAVKRLLGIGSPSKVFAGFGQAVGQGFIDGVEGMARPIGRAIEGTMGARVQAAGGDLAASLAAGGSVVGARSLRAPAGAGAGAPVTVNRHYNIQTVTGQGAPDPDYLIAQLDLRLKQEGV